MFSSLKAVLRGAWILKASMLRAVGRVLWGLLRVVALPFTAVSTIQYITLGLPRLTGTALITLTDAQQLQAALGFAVVVLVQLVNLFEAVRRKRYSSALTISSLFFFALMSVISLVFWGLSQYRVATHGFDQLAFWYPQLSVGWNLALLPFTLLFALAVLGTALWVMVLATAIVVPLVGELIKSCQLGVRKLYLAGQKTATSGH